ncbi:MAG: hypothetical protein ACE5HQ_06140 [Gemmatimonadota bacterium]
MAANRGETVAHARWRQVVGSLVAAWAVVLLPSLAAGQARSAAVGVAPTRVMVRAVARDAKVIGSGVGGARITIRNAETGEVLAEGVQRGGTGDTRAIMLDPRPRGRTAYGADPEAAGFLAELPLTKPTRVQVTAEGPLSTPGALSRASKTLLLIPGRDVLGEGIILELNGFTVRLLLPEDGDPSLAAGDRMAVRARVTMLCGCPTEPGGLWDSDRIELMARLVRGGRVVAERPLRFSGERSVFEAEMPVPEPGPLTLEVLAMDPSTANFGIVRRPLKVRR